MDMSRGNGFCNQEIDRSRKIARTGCSLADDCEKPESISGFFIIMLRDSLIYLRIFYRGNKQKSPSRF